MSARAGGTELRVGIAGLGTVGAGTVRLLRENAELIAARAGRPVVAVAITARDRARPRAVALDGLDWYDDAGALATAPGLDVVVELIGGAAGAALDCVTASLEAGRHVVTANKAMIAHHGVRLATLAEARGVRLGFEAAVAGGIPVLKTVREALAANRFARVAGILSGTCNHILTTMRETGREFADVLEEAQALGYAEADPAADIDGIDTAHKLAILAALAFDRVVPFESVHVEGIRPIGALDIGFADELGFRIKLLGIARATADGIEARVHPCLVPVGSPLARVDGVYNAVVAEGDFAGRITLEGRGAGGGPTASAVVADLIDIARGFPCLPWGRAAASLETGTMLPILAHHGAYYLRLVVLDRAGRDRRSGGGAARCRGVAEKHAAAWTGAGRSRADRAGDARDERAGDARCRDADFRAGRRRAITTADQDRTGLEGRGQPRAPLGPAPRPAPTRSTAAMSDQTTRTPYYQASDRNLALELVRVTEAAAIASSRWMGRGKKNEADDAAVGSDAARLRHDRDRRDRGHRRGRDGRGADALYRREGRTRRAADGHRRRSARGHDADRERRPERDHHRGAGGVGQLPARAGHLHGEAGGRAGPAGGHPRPRCADRRRIARPGAGQAARDRRIGDVHARPGAARGTDRQGPRGGVRGSC